jgi:hypothetical protein
LVDPEDDRSRSAQESPAPLLRREREVQLAAMVPAVVRRAVRRRAEAEGTTVRTILLRALKAAGIVEIDDDELTDRRAVAASLKSRLYRDALGR